MGGYPSAGLDLTTSVGLEVLICVITEKLNVEGRRDDKIIGHLIALELRSATKTSTKLIKEKKG